MEDFHCKIFWTKSVQLDICHQTNAKPAENHLNIVFDHATKAAVLILNTMLALMSEFSGAF